MNERPMNQAEAGDDAGLPGGAMNDPSPVDRGDGAWLWTTGGAPMNDGEPPRIDRAECEWHEEGEEHGRRGWYVLAELGDSDVRVRVGPYPNAFGVADALRDLFPASREGRADIDYLEERVGEVVDLAGDERIVRAAEALAGGGLGMRRGASPAELIAAVRSACADRDEWERRKR